MNNVITDFVPTGLSLYLVYGFMLAAAGLVLYWIRGYGASNKLVLFVVAFWLATGNYYELIIKALPGMGFFENRPAWTLMSVFLIFLFRQVLTGGLRRWRNPEWRGKLSAWEVALILCILFQAASSVSYMYNLGMVSLFKRFGDSLVVLVFVLTMVELVSKESIPVLRNAIIFAAVSSSIISILQFGIADQLFMRYGDARAAYGDYVRSVGIFTREYSNGYFLIGGIIWTLATVKNPIRRNIFVILMVIGIVTTFHRMSYTVMIVVFVMYFLRANQQSLVRIATVGLAVAVIGLTIYLNYGDNIVNSKVYKGRMSDNVDSRQGYWKLVLDNISDKPLFGFGGTDNDLYYTKMLLITRSRDRASGTTGDFHNGYLQTMWYYGVPASIAFACYVLLTLVYFGRLTMVHPFFVIPFLFAVLYLMANLTNNFSLDKYLAHLAAIYFGLGLGARFQEDPVETLPETNLLNPVS